MLHQQQKLTTQGRSRIWLNLQLQSQKMLVQLQRQQQSKLQRLSQR
jgi:hypothetical protein